MQMVFPNWQIKNGFINEMVDYFIENDYTVSSGQLLKSTDVAKGLGISKSTLKDRLSYQEFLDDRTNVAIGYYLNEKKVGKIETKIRREERCIKISDFDGVHRFLGYNDGRWNYITKLYRTDKDGKIIEPLFLD